VVKKALLLSRLAHDEAGVTAVVVGLGMTVLMGGAALALDVGLWYNDKRIAQGAADSAAYSAAIDYAAGDTAANVTATANAVAAQYGQVNGSGGVTVTVNQPPKSGTHTTTVGAVEVIVQRTETPFFASFFVNSAAVASRAVAVSGSSGGKYCVLALDTTAATTVSTAGISASNGVTIDLSTCGLQVNATGADALVVTGGAVIKATTVSVGGNYSVSNGGSLQVSGATITSAPAMADPYTSVTVPTPGSCAATNSWGSGGTFTISPGTYCNGMTISNGARVTMNAGVYIVDRGLFDLTGGATLTATAGVTIVLTSSSGSNYATATIDNGTTINITAPASGATKGLAFFQDRRAAATGTDNFAGGASMTVNGGLYFPAQMVNFSNGATSSVCTQLIAYRVTYTGGSKFMDNCTGFGTTEIGAVGTSLVE
jgi:Flp pilus assembly protein TadG